MIYGRQSYSCFVLKKIRIPMNNKRIFFPLPTIRKTGAILIKREKIGLIDYNIYIIFQVKDVLSDTIRIV